MAGLNPQVGDSTNLLLKKLVQASEALADGGLSVTIGVPEAPQDGNQYARVNGAWVQIPDPAVDGVVQNYDELPITLGTPSIGDAYLAIEAVGVYFVNRHPAGIYVRTANNGELADWVYAATLTESET